VSRALVVAVVALVALAGCGSVSDGAGRSPPAVTPAAVPTDPATPTPVPRVAPGVTAGGVVDPVALATAHRDALLGESLTRTTVGTVGADGRTLRRTNRTFSVAPYRTEFRYRYAQTVDDDYPVRATADRLDLWSNGSGTLVRVEDDADVRYRTLPADEARSLVVGITGDERVSALAGAFAFAVRERPGGVELVSTALRDPSALDVPLLTGNVTNATLRMDVAASGLVRSYTLAYGVELDGRPLRVVEQMRVTAVGETRVDRPPWYDIARGNATGGASPGGGPGASEPTTAAPGGATGTADGTSADRVARGGGGADGRERDR
jgi:hypothetical protein